MSNNVKKVKKVVIFSLSNPPTKQYIHTRHNIGRIFLEQFLLKKLNPKHKQSFPKYTKYEINQNLIVCTSQVYMNLSGKAVESFFAKNYRFFIDSSNAKQNFNTKSLVKDHLLVVQDDLDKKFGNIKIKLKGSAQGHNGNKSIISSMKTDQYSRLQLGIGRPTSKDPEIISKYVLGRFTSSQKQQLLTQVFPSAYQLLKKEHWL